MVIIKAAILKFLQTSILDLKHIIKRQHGYSSFETARPNQEPGLGCMQGVVIFM